MKKLLMLGLMLLVVSVAYGQWETMEREDLMEGTSSTILGNPAVVAQGTLRTPAIIIRATDDAFIYWGGYDVDGGTRSIQLRIDDNEPENISVSLSADDTATFMPDDFVQRIMGAKEIIARVRKATGNPMVAKWDVSGLSVLIERVE